MRDICPLLILRPPCPFVERFGFGNGRQGCVLARKAENLEIFCRRCGPECGTGPRQNILRLPAFRLALMLVVKPIRSTNGEGGAIRRNPKKPRNRSMPPRNRRGVIQSMSNDQRPMKTTQIGRSDSHWSLVIGSWTLVGIWDLDIHQQSRPTAARYAFLA